MFFVVKRTESVIDATVTVHSEQDILENVGGDSLVIVGYFITSERLFSVEWDEWILILWTSGMWRCVVW
jgi:hypothetical protein